MLGARLEIRNLQFEKQFERDFMRRTLKLVQEYQGPYDATLLLNCLLGLLIVPKEISREQIPTDPISKLKDWGISPGSIKRVGKKNDKNQHPETLRGIVYNLRNWIAHIRVKPTGDKQAGEGVYVYRQERIRGNNRSR
ncbi:MAG: hypothetical protein H0T64_00610 [Pyrinomonadaceae bacterium]|nr:hypothetical protein [Pyrinomonadaceae bacterium]MBA3568826.1 hypothetical protein [Pyrinomonadaceae bacterium]